MNTEERNNVSEQDNVVEYDNEGCCPEEEFKIIGKQELSKMIEDHELWLSTTEESDQGERLNLDGFNLDEFKRTTSICCSSNAGISGAFTPYFVSTLRNGEFCGVYRVCPHLSTTSPNDNAFS